MPEPEPDIELRRRWWLRLRRAFGVPDLITDDHARAVVAHRMVVAHPLDLLIPGQSIDVATDLVEKLLDGCSRGYGDCELVTAEESRLLVGDDPRVRFTIMNKVLNPRNIESQNTINAAMAMIDQMFQSILDLVEQMPFEDADGRYFSGPS